MSRFHTEGLPDFRPLSAYHLTSERPWNRLLYLQPYSISLTFGFSTLYTHPEEVPQLHYVKGVVVVRRGRDEMKLFSSIHPVIHPWMASYINPLQCEG
jgi:hypothetical protein